MGFKVKSAVVIKLASIVRCPAVAEPGVAPSALSELILNDPAFISVVAVCVFIPVNLGIDNAIATFRYYVGEKRMGNISLVGTDSNGENGGILLLLDMNSSVRKKLKKIAKRR